MEGHNRRSESRILDDNERGREGGVLRHDGHGREGGGDEDILRGEGGRREHRRRRAVNARGGLIRTEMTTARTRRSRPWRCRGCRRAARPWSRTWTWTCREGRRPRGAGGAVQKAESGARGVASWGASGGERAGTFGRMIPRRRLRGSTRRI